VRIYKVKNYEEMSKRAAFIIASQVNLNPKSVLGLATGSTPEGTYANLIKMYQDGILDFSQVKTANLDEYKGLTKDHDQSYAYFMKETLFKHINIDLNNTNIPNGMADDTQAECFRYEKVIEDLGGVDLQLLGIGNNGHIAFNEPADSFPPITQVTDLTESTIEANSRLFVSAADVPTKAFTMGIGTIMKSKKILLIASGTAKADALKATVEGKVIPDVPASILQLHRDVIIIADEAALSKTKI